MASAIDFVECHARYSFIALTAVAVSQRLRKGDRGIKPRPRGKRDHVGKRATVRLARAA